MHATAHDPRLARRAVVAATCGNALEFYDFVTYAYFAIQIGHTFFPSSSAYLSLLGSLATFGAGFGARPLGAWVIGGYADRHGRKKGMFLSLLLMGVGIVLLACTPGYATIGIAAPILAIVARLAQGFALGGEVGAATTYMLESVPPERRGWASSWQNSSQMIAFTAGALVAFVLSLWLSDDQLGRYGWRVALLLGTSILPFALIIRRSLPDHPVHHDAPMTEAESLSATPGGFARIVILGMLIIGAGWLSDKVGRRPAMIWPQLAFVLMIMPMFAWFFATPTVAAFLTLNIVLSGLGTMPFSAAFTAVSESLPRHMRARAFALVYTIPVTTMGGTTQFNLAWLLHRTGNAAVLEWYMMGIACMGLAAMLFLPESAPLSIRRKIATTPLTAG